MRSLLESVQWHKTNYLLFPNKKPRTHIWDKSDSEKSIWAKQQQEAQACKQQLSLQEAFSEAASNSVLRLKSNFMCFLRLQANTRTLTTAFFPFNGREYRNFSWSCWSDQPVKTAAITFHMWHWFVGHKPNSLLLLMCHVCFYWGYRVNVLSVPLTIGCLINYLWLLQ